jgi:methyltransferase (TIGR00027 family)
MHAVSQTARWTAAARAKESAREDAIFVDPYAAELAGPEGHALFARYDNPGVGEFIAIRTRYLDDLLARPHAQVVLLAAGLDTRTARLPWPSGAVVYEVDHPELLEYKDKHLANVEHRCDRRPVPADLTADWLPSLAAAGWDQTIPTLWIAEGLLFYLTELEARTLLETIAAHSAPASTLAGDLLSHKSMNSDFSQDALRRLTEDGSPWRFGTDDPESFLATCGWETTELLCPGEPGASYDRWPWNPPLPRDVQGFPRNYLFKARRAL